MVAEDYTRPQLAAAPTPYATAPLYRHDYEDALRAAGIRFDTYDVDANGRTARDAPRRAVALQGRHLGDRRRRDRPRPGAARSGRPESGGGTGTELLFDQEVLNARDYMNEGGKLLVAGQFALEGAWEQQTLQPARRHAAAAVLPGEHVARQRLREQPARGRPRRATSWPTTSSSTGWGRTRRSTAATPGRRRCQELPPIGTSTFTLNGADSKQNQQNLYRFLTTSDILPPATYPQFQSNVAIKVEGPAGVRPADGQLVRVLAGRATRPTSGCRRRST